MPYTYPKALVAGTNENVNDLNTNLNGAAADWEHAFSAYRTVLVRQAIDINSNGVSGAGVFQLSGETISSSANQVPFYFDPADWSAAPRITKLRVRADLAVNGTAPGISFTVGLYPVTAVGGGTNSIALTIGAVVTGSTVALGTPLASSLNQGNSGDFTSPAAGYYVLGCACSGGVAVNSMSSMFATLQYRQV